MDSELKGKPGELRFTIEVKRAATGKVETFDMVGQVEEAPPETLVEIDRLSRSETRYQISDGSAPQEKE